MEWAAGAGRTPRSTLRPGRAVQRIPAPQAAGTEVPKEILAGDENDLSTWLDEHPF